MRLVYTGWTPIFSKSILMKLKGLDKISGRKIVSLQIIFGGKHCVAGRTKLIVYYCSR